jgi:hypothetical protein
MKHPTHRPLSFALKISWHCREWQEVFGKQHVKFTHVKHWQSRTGKGFHVSIVHLILLNTDRPHKFTKYNHSIRVQVKQLKNLARKENWAITISVEKLPNQAKLRSKPNPGWPNQTIAYKTTFRTEPNKLRTTRRKPSPKWHKLMQFPTRYNTNWHKFFWTLVRQSCFLEWIHCNTTSENVSLQM